MALSNNAGTISKNINKNLKQLKRKSQRPNSNTSWNIEEGYVSGEPGKLVKSPRVEADSKILESPQSQTTRPVKMELTNPKTTTSNGIVFESKSNFRCFKSIRKQFWSEFFRLWLV